MSNEFGWNLTFLRSIYHLTTWVGFWEALVPFLDAIKDTQNYIFWSIHISSGTKIFALSMVVFSSRKRISSSESFVLLCASPMATARISSLEIFLNYLPWPESAGFSRSIFEPSDKMEGLVLSQGQTFWWIEPPSQIFWFNIDRVFLIPLWGLGKVQKILHWKISNYFHLK